MADTRAEPFQVALTALRRRLQEGVLPPGQRIAAVDLADALKLSTTPVREALSRLAGEGLIEDRRGQGYFVRSLSAGDIADLYRLSLAHLLIAQDPQRTPRRPREAHLPASPGPPPQEALERVETLFRQWMLEAGSRALTLAFRALQVQLGPVRRREPQLFDDLAEEAAQLAAADADGPEGRLPLLRRFHGRRIRAADQLAELFDAPTEAAKNSPDIV